MFTTIPSLRLLAAPATAVLLMGALFILEERHFDQKSALLLALVTGVAVAEILPAAALGLVFVALVLQSLKIFPLILLSGVLSYAVVPVVIFFAVIGWKTRNRWVLPVAAVVFAGVITVNWFTDQTWINFIFGNQLYGRGLLRSLTYAFLIFGAFAALNLAAWAVGVAVNNVSRSRRAQLAAEARLRETATELAVEQERNRIAGELHDVLAHSLTVIVAQADGIRFIHRTEPESVEEASRVIAESARTALVETRRLVEGFSADLSNHPTHKVEDLAILADRLELQRHAGHDRNDRRAMGHDCRPGADGLPTGAGEPDQRFQARGPEPGHAPAPGLDRGVPRTPQQIVADHQPGRDAEDDTIRSGDSRHAGSRRSCRRMGGNSPGRRDLRSAGVPPLGRS